jgi:hypothetical protein
VTALKNNGSHQNGQHPMLTVVQGDVILHLIWMGMEQTGIGTILCRLIRLNFLKMASTSRCLASTDASSHLPASKAMAHSSSS